MKKYSFFFPKNGLLIRLLLIISLASFNHSAIADGDISEAEIMRVAKIAKATGTNITVVRVTTTVKVYGSNKKTNKKVKRTVLKFMKSKKSKWSKVGTSGSATNNFAGRPPTLEDPGMRAPILEVPRAASSAPTLNNDYF